MRFLPGDNTDKDVTLWPVEPLTWWRGERSFVPLENPFERDEAERIVLQEAGLWDGIEVDHQNGEQYTLTLQDAMEVFWKYADAGKMLESGAFFNDSMHDFLIKYGVPCDYANTTPNERHLETRWKRRVKPRYWSYIGQIEKDARRANTCVQLLKNIRSHSHSKLRDYASTTEIEEGTLISFFPDFDFLDFEPDGILINKPIDGISRPEWLSLAEQALREMVSYHSPVISLKEDTASNQLTLTLNGLHNALWLAFRLYLADAFEVEQFTKRCLKDEHHHGCGELFVPRNNRDKLCPKCRAKAKTERQRSWRERKKKQEAEQ